MSFDCFLLCDGFVTEQGLIENLLGSLEVQERIAFVQELDNLICYIKEVIPFDKGNEVLLVEILESCVQDIEGEILLSLLVSYNLSSSINKLIWTKWIHGHLLPRQIRCAFNTPKSQVVGEPSGGVEEHAVLEFLFQLFSPARVFRHVSERFYK